MLDERFPLLATRALTARIRRSRGSEATRHAFIHIQQSMFTVSNSKQVYCILKNWYMGINLRGSEAAGGWDAARTANLRTKIPDFRGLGSSIILISRGGILTSIWIFLETRSQQILVEITVVVRLGVCAYACVCMYARNGGM